MRITSKNQIQTKFYTLPKLLWFGKYSDLDNNARVLYVVITDLIGFSPQHGWVNQQGEIFVRIKQENMAVKIGVSRRTIVDILVSLEKVGLIDRERNGRTIPDDIYPHVPDLSTEVDENHGMIEENLLYTENKK